jgi:hypothetical protein
MVAEGFNVLMNKAVEDGKFRGYGVGTDEELTMRNVILTLIFYSILTPTYFYCLFIHSIYLFFIQFLLSHVLFHSQSLTTSSALSSPGSGHLLHLLPTVLPPPTSLSIGSSFSDHPLFSGSPLFPSLSFLRP